MNQKIKKADKLSRTSWLVVLLPTLLYWFWESRAEGNLRVDLLVIYPTLFAVYTRALWSAYRFWAFFMALFIMLVNVLFFVFSYDLFGKYPG